MTVLASWYKKISNSLTYENRFGFKAVFSSLCYKSVGNTLLCCTTYSFHIQCISNSVTFTPKSYTLLLISTLYHEKHEKTFLGTGIALTLLSACAPKQSQETLTKSGLNPTNYETIVDGVKPVKLYTLKNAAGMEVCVTNFGGRIVSIMVPDKTEI